MTGRTITRSHVLLLELSNTRQPLTSAPTESSASHWSKLVQNHFSLVEKLAANQKGVDVKNHEVAKLLDSPFHY